MIVFRLRFLFFSFLFLPFFYNQKRSVCTIHTYTKEEKKFLSTLSRDNLKLLKDPLPPIYIR